MSVVVRLFAAAAEAAGCEETAADAASETDLRAELSARFGPDFARVLGRCSLMSAGSRLGEGDPIADGATVDVLPPFAGG